MFDKIVVPLDGSKLAEVALPYAEELAGKTGAEIVLLSVLQSAEQLEYENFCNYSQKLIDATRRHAEKYKGKYRGQFINVGTATRIGSPAEGIMDYVSNGNSKLIVMATHGRSGVSRWAVGSVADKVVRTTLRQPLLLIRARGAHPDIRAKRILKKALVPLDGSLRSEAVISHIADMAHNLHMEITLFQAVQQNHHTREDAEAYLKGWCRQLEEKGVSAEYEVREGSAADQIINVADELAMDLVAMATHGQTALSNIWPLGSVAQKVLLAGDTPLMLVRT